MGRIILGVGVVLLLILGISTVMGAPWLAIPLFFLALAAVGGVQMMQSRQRAVHMRQFREQADSDNIDFTERDRQTVVEDRS